SMLDKRFPLTCLQALVSVYAVEEGLPPAPSGSETATVLWGQAFLNEEAARQFKQAVVQNDIEKISMAINKLTARLDSPEKEAAVEFLAETAGHGLLDKTKNPDRILALFKKISLPEPQSQVARFIAPKSAFLDDCTQKLWMELDLLFADPGEQDLAKALILVTIAEKLHTRPELAYEIELQNNLETFFRVIGCGEKICFDEMESDEGRNLAVAAILEQALAFDPENPKAYELILDIPLDSPALRKALPPLLELMTGTFPHDPRPYLRMAQIYLQKSAVRKAEGALKQAFLLAPHDGDVLKQYALCHVATACKNIKRGKYGLALQDLDAAKNLGVSSLGVYIAEKRLLCLFAQTRKFSRKGFEEITHGLCLSDTLRVLGLFKLDLADPDNDYPAAPRGLAAVFNSYKKQTQELNSGEIASLLQPVPVFCREFYFHKNCAEYFLDKRGKILNGLTDKNFMDITLDLAKQGGLDQVIDQLGKRVNDRKEDDDCIFMKFLYFSLFHIRGDKVSSRIFLHIIDSASSPLKERLRRVSRQVAAIAPKPVQAAYEQFDFTLLDRPLFPSIFPFDIDPEDMEGFAEFAARFMGKAMEDGGDVDNPMKALMDVFMDHFDDDVFWDDDDYWDDDDE
ncbi:MAG: hypothetical protein LC657_12100, partial [Desulfobacteraceae bacterium]|nr:hypothetical protein [Desulfobacteraceae bacterium]